MSQSNLIQNLEAKGNQKFRMESVSKAHARMLKFPKLLAECRLEGSMYAACISTNQDNIKKDGCKEEFDKLRKCVVKAAAKLGTRI
ncbi:uncharacterized protein LOC124364625 isoform X2 [Homalodisca vitripennis]|uniref:uncharacterized protein LOC124364625 isoform X2 n=1 Tax=Homalodisca vitripennis TaxID=197043 RepID=UPI001EEB0B3E|nr:uncharacterized protein LOC124364625 isoform X2 [Homalodisca vitripennis]